MKTKCNVALAFLSILILFISLNVNVVNCKKKYILLEPVKAILTTKNEKEPSGLTYCKTTNLIYSNCDKCKFLTVYDVDLNYNSTLYFPDSIKDVEGVACDHVHGLIYIAEEGNRIVHGFKLDDYTRKSGKDYLKEVSKFSVKTGDATSHRSGIEGLTVNTQKGTLLCANEKSPKLLVEFTSYSGQVLKTIDTFPEALDARDFSGLAYDEQLDLLWILSDQSERVYLTNFDATIVYDYWDVPVTNPEGIAINNQHKPQRLYITTDPSAPSGPQYVGSIFSFKKPEIGSGYSDFENNKNKTYNDHCEGCNEVYKEAQKKLSEYYKKQEPNKQTPDLLGNNVFYHEDRTSDFHWSTYEFWYDYSHFVNDNVYTNHSDSDDDEIIIISVLVTVISMIIVLLVISSLLALSVVYRKKIKDLVYSLTDKLSKKDDEILLSANPDSDLDVFDEDSN